jgi:hypothetical protein
MEKISEVVNSLLEQAKKEENSGNYKEASSLDERAQRIIATAAGELNLRSNNWWDYNKWLPSRYRKYWDTQEQAGYNVEKGNALPYTIGGASAGAAGAALGKIPGMGIGRSAFLGGLGGYGLGKWLTNPEYSKNKNLHMYDMANKGGGFGFINTLEQAGLNKDPKVVENALNQQWVYVKKAIDKFNKAKNPQNESNYRTLGKAWLANADPVLYILQNQLAFQRDRGMPLDPEIIAIVNNLHSNKRILEQMAGETEAMMTPEKYTP